MSLEQFTLTCFSIGVGLFILVDHPTIKEIAKWVGGLGGIIFGLLQIFNA